MTRGWEFVMALLQQDVDIREGTVILDLNGPVRCTG
jgi:hypothetical protein